MSRQKSKLGQKRQFGKSAFTGFTPKALPILDFGMQHWNNAKIQPIKKSKLFKMLYCSFCHFSSILGHLSEVFWIIGVTFFILIASASNLVGCYRTQMWKCIATFSFLCVWYQRYDILHVKNDQNSLKKSTNLFWHFPKDLHNSCLTIFTNFGSWPTFSVPNEFF